MRFVIIGNGAAGNAAAETIRKYDENAEIIMFSSEAFPEYSACALPDYISGWIPRSHLFLKDYDDYKHKQIKIEWGQSVTEIDTVNKQVITEKGMTKYDKLIIASGSRAFIPPINGVNLSGNFVIKSVSDVDRIIEHEPSQVVVVGSGNIGVEAAEALEIRGCKVTLIELLGRVMPKAFDAKASALLYKILTNNNIRVLTDEKVLEVKGLKQVEELVTNRRNIPCDTVIWTVGVRQNVELAQKSGISIGKLGGIKVNSRMETSQQDIYACGDCIESIDLLTGQPALSLLWPNAKRQAQVAALNCLGKPTEYEGSVNIIVEEIYDTLCVSIGFTEEMLSGRDFQVIENGNERFYYRIVISNGLIVGWQSIGISNGIGTILALIKTRTPIAEVKRVWQNSDLVAKVPWYLTAGNFLFHEFSSI